MNLNQFDVNDERAYREETREIRERKSFKSFKKAVMKKDKGDFRLLRRNMRRQEQETI